MSSILIIDDDPEILQMMQLLLDRSEHIVVPVDTLKEAGQMLENSYFDFVFLDGMSRDNTLSPLSFLSNLPSHFKGEIVCTSEDDSKYHDFYERGVKRRVHKYDVDCWLRNNAPHRDSAA